MQVVGYFSELFTLGGDVIIAYAVLAVHDRMREEHKIDDNVYHTMVKERRIVILGIILVFIGFALGVWERAAR